MHLKSNTVVKTLGYLRMHWTCSDYVSNRNQWTSSEKSSTAKPESSAFERNVWTRVNQEKCSVSKEKAGSTTYYCKLTCPLSGTWSLDSSNILLNGLHFFHGSRKSSELQDLPGKSVKLFQLCQPLFLSLLTQDKWGDVVWMIPGKQSIQGQVQRNLPKLCPPGPVTKRLR